MMKRVTFYSSVLSIYLSLIYAYGERENLQLVAIITSRSTTNYVANLINAIPERKYRLALMLNSIPVYDFLKFPDKQCAVKKMKETKYHRNGQNSFCCSLTQLNPSSRFTNILIITDQRMRDDERDCAVMFYMQHRSNMYIIEYDPLEEKDMVYWVREEFNHIKVSLQTDRHTALPFVEDKLLDCRGNELYYQFDECRRRCLCIDGRLTHCYRVRKEFSRMTFNERLRYINAYKTVSTTQPFQAEFDRYVDIHVRLFSEGIHRFPQFLPFHRRYLLGFEDLLRKVDCRVTVPIWNWARHSPNAWHPNPSYHMWDNIGGFGGNGSSSDYCVRSGQFAKGLWMTSGTENWKYVEKLTQVHLKTNGYKYGYTEEYDNDDDDDGDEDEDDDDDPDVDDNKDVGRHTMSVCGPLLYKGSLQREDSHLNSAIRNTSHNCLRRGFSCLPPDLQRVTDYLNCLQPSQFKLFNSFISLWHNRIHNCTLGQMANEYSSHTPEFWLHHTMLDALWDNWQRRGHLFKDQSVYHNDSLFLLGFPYDLARHFVDNDALGDCVRIAYPSVLGNKTMSNEHHMPKTEDYEQWSFGDAFLLDFTEANVNAMKRKCEKKMNSNIKEDIRRRT